MMMQHDYNGIEIHIKSSGIVIVKIQFYKTHSQHSIFVTPWFLYRIVFIINMTTITTGLEFIQNIQELEIVKIQFYKTHS